MSSPAIPHLVETETSKQLVVNGKPFLMLAAELQNSSLTSAEYMDSKWKDMAAANINTVLGCVTWEMIEPVEGQFCFEHVDKVILGARENGLHLVLLWFGSFKNGMSTYTPSWVKTNPKRFPRAKLRKAGGILETADVVSLFHTEAQKADARAFAKLMSHIKEVDEQHSTVIMVQVENEPGLLGDSRDACPAANQRFSEPAPEDLLSFLSQDWELLHPDIKSHLSHFATQSVSGMGTPHMSWEAAFGSGPYTDELFMAYHYAYYVDQVAAAGKAVYPIPLYTNAWLNSSGDDADNGFPNIASGGGTPGNYPSGGPTSGVLDVWQRFAPHLDFLAPDIYLNDYDAVCGKYRHRNQPLFIPEQRRDEYGARRIWRALGSYGALGISPFGIDTVELHKNAFTRHYELLKSVSSLVLDAQRKPDSSVGFFFDELRGDGTDPNKPILLKWGDYEIEIQRCFVFGKPGPGSGMVIRQGGGRFLLIGWGFQVSARALEPKASFCGILRFEEKIADEITGELRTRRVLNGDETKGGMFAMMPNGDPDYGGFPVSITVPAETMIAEVEFYHIVESD